MTELLARFAPGIAEWLTLCAVLYAIGLYGLLTRRNAIAILMAVEIMLNAAALNFVAFNRFIAPDAVDGHVMAIFIIVMAAAEIVVGMAIVVALYRLRGSVDVNQMNSMKG
ncbi:MAG: NADH-quinone oxidoreductase subunit NuoK [Candidatus Hydrogenedentes bacterium]|nr:NADH-quinone oxidoreductase subunit NuoK [Candidatus Hydrogenedentota bacterium]